MSDTYKSGVNSHYCNVEVGEAINQQNRQTLRIDMDKSNTEYMFSGRVIYKGISEDGTKSIATLGWPTTGNYSVFVAHRGVDHADVAIPDNMTNLIGRISVGGQLSGIPIRDGIVLNSSEFTADLGSSDVGTEIYVVTNSTDNPAEEIGKFTVADPEDEDIEEVAGPIGLLTEHAARVSHYDENDTSPGQHRAWDLNLVTVEFIPSNQLSEFSVSSVNQ